jgi:dienelactone hydrolase
MLLAMALCAAHAAEPSKIEERAKALVTALDKEDFAAASKHFAEAVAQALPGDKLADIWKGIVKQVGPLKKQGKATAEKVQGHDVIWVECVFEKATLYTRVVFDGEGRVTGLSFRPTGPAGEYKPPSYVKRGAFRDSAAQVGEGEWVLPATLTVPVGDGPFPAVVLVHGSGPNDRDETIGGHRPFRDLAEGLASQGVAVLRYEKRTRQHGVKFVKIKDYTIKEETLDDALAAAALLRKTKDIDPGRVFVVGHSLGAMAAPRLGELDGQLAGLILMAGPSRPMADVIMEQLDYVESLDRPAAGPAKAVLDKLRSDAEKMKDPKGEPGAYWLSVRDLRQVETAQKVKQPLLILQGGRDYQSTMTDFEGWKKALSGRKGATLKSYPNLNHAFAEGEGKAKPAEYLKEGHVAKDVVDDIATWVKAQPPAR